MVCPKCKSENVTISMEQVASKSAKKGIGFGGHVNNAARKFVGWGSFGISNLFWKKSTGSEKTKFTNQKVCLCQNCGYSWNIK